MKRTIAIFLSLIMLFTFFAIPVNAEEKSSPSGISYSEIQAEIEGYVKECERGLASAAVAVFEGDETLYSGYFGYSDIENSIFANAETVYEWGSCSKLLVWVSVMQLFEDGLLDLETDIRTYIPDYFFAKLAYDEPITMLNLMNHTAGWQETVYDVEVTDKNKIVPLETALRNTEPAQAYKPGEHTAYSNWGTALAAYIVQRISGMDYIKYVHENIFQPLSMEHTSVGSDYSDNAYVMEKRADLKSYMIMEDINESLGSNISYILLYPAGSATGTLTDFTTFARAFVSDSCPLFDKAVTREKMLSATSYYGDSDIVKNCHGLWTSEYAVQTLGHAGNTNACSSIVQFNLISGLGVVVMTNECGETAFNYGIPSLLFGEIPTGKITESTDISGVYVASRGYHKGFLNVFNCIGSGVFMPVAKTDDADTFSIVGIDMKRISDNRWVQDNGNGTKMFFYETYRDGKRVFETMSTDYIIDDFYWCKVGAIIVVLLLVVASVVTLVVKRIRRKNSDKAAILTQILLIASGALLLIIISASSVTKTFAVIFCLLEAVIALLSLSNAVYMIYRTIKSEQPKKRDVARNILWTICNIFTFGFIIYFQLFNFWNC